MRQLRPIRLLERGDRYVRADDVNALIAELARLSGIEVEGGEVDTTGSSLRLRVARPEQGIWAKITSGTNPYAWTEQTPTTGGAFTNTTNGRTGTTSQDPAYELNDNSTVAANTIVRLEKTFVTIGATVSQEWTFLAAVSGSSALTVREVDGSPSIGSVNTIEFDQTDGIVVSNPGAGIARIDLSGISGMAFSGVKALNGATQSIAPTTFTSLTYDTELFDTGGYFSPTSANFTTVADTYYAIGVEFQVAELSAAFTLIANLGGRTSAQITWKEVYVGAGGGSPMSRYLVNLSSIIKSHTSPESVNAQVYHTGASNVTIQAAMMWMFKLGT